MPFKQKVQKKKILPKISAQKAGKDNNLYKGLDKAAEIAMYYGFIPNRERISITKEDISKAKAEFEEVTDSKSIWQHHSICPESKIALLRTYAEKNMSSTQQPVSWYFDHTSFDRSQKNKPLGDKIIGLEILGTGKSIAEAILIQTSIEILKEAGYQNVIIELNSVGDKDSTARFLKDLINYCRKNLESFEQNCRQALKRNPFEMFDCECEQCRDIMSKAPRPISFLSEPSRNHFKEVIEYLEMLEIPYRINDKLLGCRSFASQTVFGIKNTEEGTDQKPLGVGIRYNGLAKRIGFKKDLPAIGATLLFNWNDKTKSNKCPKIKNPKIYFIQLGFEAKLKSLKVIEILRQAKVPIYQSLSRDKMASQIGMAENMKIPYAIIMGQKEAFEESVIVRNMNTRAQETVMIGKLPDYLKRIK